MTKSQPLSFRHPGPCHASDSGQLRCSLKFPACPSLSSFGCPLLVQFSLPKNNSRSLHPFLIFQNSPGLQSSFFVVVGRGGAGAAVGLRPSCYSSTVRPWPKEHFAPFPRDLWRMAVQVIPGELHANCTPSQRPGFDSLVCPRHRGG